MKLIEVVRHPKIRGDWQVRAEGILPYPLWYKSKEDAVSYAKWLVKDNKGKSEFMMTFSVQSCQRRILTCKA